MNMIQQQQERSWWSRNWKWFVPVASVGAIGSLVLLVVLILSFVFGLMKSSGAYKDAVAKAKADSAVVEALGSPIEEGMLVSGSINTSGSSGDADLSIPISGPEGEATIFVTASKSAGQWTFSVLIVEIKGTEERIDLLE